MSATPKKKTRRGTARINQYNGGGRAQPWLRGHSAALPRLPARVLHACRGCTAGTPFVFSTSGGAFCCRRRLDSRRLAACGPAAGEPLLGSRRRLLCRRSLRRRHRGGRGPRALCVACCVSSRAPGPATVGLRGLPVLRLDRATASPRRTSVGSPRRRAATGDGGGGAGCAFGAAGIGGSSDDKDRVLFFVIFYKSLVGILDWLRKVGSWCPRHPLKRIWANNEAIVVWAVGHGAALGGTHKNHRGSEFARLLFSSLLDQSAEPRGKRIFH